MKTIISRFRYGLIVLLAWSVSIQFSYAQKHENRVYMQAKKNLSGDKPDSVVSEAYIEDGWKYDVIYRYDYDETGFNTQWTALTRNDENTAWLNGWKENYFKDPEGNIGEYISSGWSNDSAKWIPQRKVNYTYNDDNNMTGDSVFYWNNSEWIKASKGVFIVDENANTIADTIYNWVIDEEIWIYDYMDEYTFDENYNMIEVKGYSWIKETSEWNPEGWNVFLWENGNHTLRTGYDWDETDLQWSLDNKTEYFFNMNSEDSLTYYYIWDNTGEEWKNFYKVERTYDAVGRLHIYIYYDWNAGLNQFVPNQKQTYYYSEQSTGLSVTGNAEFFLYPNPSDKFLQIKTDGQLPNEILLTVYNLQGVTIWSQNCTVSDLIDVSSIPSGIYLYKIEYRDSYKTGKLLIEK